MIFKSLQTRIVLFFCALFVLIQIITIYGVYDASHRNVVALIKDQLLYSGSTFKRNRQDQTQELTESTRILASDFGFRSAIASLDKTTVMSAINNLRARTKADRIVLLNLDKHVIADTQNNAADNISSALTGLLDQAQIQRHAAGSIDVSQSLYEFTVLPVLAPVPIAWIAVANRIDDSDVMALKDVLPRHVEISFARQNTNAHWKILASTLPVATREPLSEHMIGIGRGANVPVLKPLANEDYLTLVLPLDEAFKSSTVAILQIPLSAALAPYKPLLQWLVTLAALGVLLALFGGIFVARSITKPVRELASAAVSIEQGNYQVDIDVTQKDELGKLAHAFKHMVNGVSEREKKIRYHALHDVNTGLGNRFAFELHLQESICSAKNSPEEQVPFSLILVGLNRFKETKNTLGHNVVEKMVGQIGKRLSNAVPQSSMIARLGDSSIVLLLPDSAKNDVHTVCDNIFAALNHQVTVESYCIDISTYVGIVNYPEHGDNTQTLMQRAEVAAAFARESTQNRSMYDPDNDPFHPDQLSMMGELRKGLQSNELELYAQPTVDLKTNRMVHVEFLVRWTHPERGIMFPDEFIPLAERTGDIHRLTAWVLSKAIEQLQTWHRAGINLSGAVNLSVNDLLNTDLPEYIGGLLRGFQVSSDMLHLEVTESAIMRDPNAALRVMALLKNMGMPLSIDDYGTGYSSMSYLKQLPVDALKIDKSFVQNLATNRHDQAIVRSTLELARSLGLEVIAEGIEDAEALEFLRSHGCDFAQGYYISRPIPIPELDNWLTHTEWYDSDTENSDSAISA